MEEELSSHKMREFCKCFPPPKGELPGKSLLLTFPPPKELHGMFCHTLIKKQQGKKTSLWMAHLRQLTAARVERTTSDAVAHLIIGELRKKRAMKQQQVWKGEILLVLHSFSLQQLLLTSLASHGQQMTSVVLFGGGETVLLNTTGTLLLSVPFSPATKDSVPTGFSQSLTAEPALTLHSI